MVNQKLAEWVLSFCPPSPPLLSQYDRLVLYFIKMLLPNGRAEVEGRREEGNKGDWEASHFRGVRERKNQAFMPLMSGWRQIQEQAESLFFLSLDEATSCDIFFNSLSPFFKPMPLPSVSPSSSHSIPLPPPSQQPSQLQVIRLTTALWHTKSDDKLIVPSWWKEQRKDGRWWALIRNFGKSSPLQPWALHEKISPSLTFSVSLFLAPSFCLSLPPSSHQVWKARSAVEKEKLFCQLH